ncbi:MAG: AcrR family transcriptional regulator [Patiriisocius sp.]|jgi:AcrR family transcriptional regulator
MQASTKIAANTKSRGRPKQYDPEQAILAAMQVFWTKGLAATSLDDLSTAMDMNRPSIYNAFGSKEVIYLRALNTFCGQLDAALDGTLGQAAEFQLGLLSFYYQAIDVYCGPEAQLGCFLACTAPVEVINHEGVSTALASLINDLDQKIAVYVRDAVASGSLAQPDEPMVIAKLIQGVLHTLALRARAGEPRIQLRKLARYSVKHFCR